MLRVIAVLALCAGCLMLSTCGTARAIAGDYEDDVIIRNIRPLSAVSGEDAVFEADICTTDGVKIDESGIADVKFTWDFGGGAEPDVSFEEMPEVVIRDGIRAPYAGTLTIRGGCVPEGEEVTATFTLEVAPLTVLTVSPTTGLAGSPATFSALIGSGNVTEYAWDFGGACSPNGSNQANPTVVVDENASGVYQCRLLVSNQFEALEFPFTLTVR